MAAVAKPVAEARAPGPAKNRASTVCAVYPTEGGLSSPERVARAQPKRQQSQRLLLKLGLLDLQRTGRRQNQYSWSHPMQLDLLGSEQVAPKDHVLEFVDMAPKDHHQQLQNLLVKLGLLRPARAASSGAAYRHGA